MALAFSREQKSKGTDNLNDVLDVKVDKNSTLATYEGPINEWFDKKFEDFLTDASADLGLLKLDDRSLATAIDAYFDNGTVFDELVNFVVDTADEYGAVTEELKIELRNLDLEITKDGLDKVLAKEVNSEVDKRYINAFVYRYVAYIKEGGASVSMLTDELSELFDNPAGDTHFIVSDANGSLYPWTIRKTDLATWFSDLNSGGEFVFSHVVFSSTGGVQSIVLKESGLTVNVSDFERSCADPSVSYQTYEVVRGRQSPVCLTCDQDRQPVRPDNPGDQSESTPVELDRQVEYIPENTGNKYIEYTHFCPDLPLQGDGSGFDRNQRGDVRLDRNPDRVQRKAVKKLAKYYGEISSQVDYYNDLPINLGLGEMTETTSDRKVLKTFKKGMHALGDQVVPILAQYDVLYNNGELQPFFDADYNIAVQEYEEMKSEAEKGGRTAAERRALREKKRELRSLKKSIKGEYKDHKRGLKDMYQSDAWEALLDENRISKREARLLYEMGEDYVRYRENQSQYPVYKRLIGLIEMWAKGENDAVSYGDDDGYGDKENMGMLRNRVHDMDASLQAKDNIDADLDEEFGVGKTIRKWSRAYEALTGVEISKTDRKSMKYYASRESVHANSLSRLSKRTKSGEPLYMLVEARIQGMTVDQAYDAWVLTNAIKIRYEGFQPEFDAGYDAAALCAHGDAGKVDLLVGQETYQRGINHRLIIQMLSDFNLDGYVKHSDSGEKSGLQITNSFWAAVADMRVDNAFAMNDQPDHTDTNFMVRREGQALCNMIAYMQKQFEARGYGHLLSGNYLQGLTPETAYVLRNRMKQSPALVKAMQDILKNSSIDLVDIFAHGGDAAAQSVEAEKDMTDYLNGKVSAWMSDLDGRFGEISENFSAEQKRLWNEYRNHIQGGLITALYRAAEQGQDPYTLAAALQPDLVLADWGSGQLDLLVNLGGVLNADVADMSSHTVDPLAAGALSVNQRLGRGASVHGTGGMGLAGWYISTGIRIRLGGNENKVIKTLRDKGLKETRLTADAFLINGIPGGRVGIDASRDMPAWLNEQYDVHQKIYKKVFVDVLNQIDTKTVVSSANRAMVRKTLRKHFPDFVKLSDEQQDKRVQTLLYDLAQYSGAFSDTGSKEYIATKLSEHYALQVRNYMFQEGKASRYHRSGVSVGVGIIGSIPFVDASIGWKSYGRYTGQDTLISKLAAKTAEWKGYGDMEVSLGTSDFVDYMNDQLFGLPAMQSYLHLTKPIVEPMVVKDGMVIIPRSVWESGRCNLKVNKKMQGYIRTYDYDGDGTAESYAFSNAISMRWQRFLYESHLGFVLNVGYPGATGVSPQDVIEVRRGVDLPSDFVLDNAALPSDIPPGLGGEVEGNTEVVASANIKSAITAFEGGNTLDLFDEDAILSLPNGGFTIPLKAGGSLSLAVGKDLQIVKNPDGTFNYNTIDGGANGFDIVYLPDGPESFSYEKLFTNIETKINSDQYLTTKISVSKNATDPTQIDFLKKSDGSVLATVPMLGHYKLKDEGGVLSLETVSTDTSFVLESGGPCEYPVSLTVSDTWSAYGQEIEDATYDWKVTQKHTYAFTLYELQNHQDDYVAFRQAMDDGRIDMAIYYATELMKAIGSSDHVAELNNLTSVTTQVKAEVLSYYEGLLSSVAAVGQIDRDTFKLIWKGAGNTFGDLIRSRESGLRRHLTKDSEFSPTNIDDFMSTIKDALNSHAFDDTDQADAGNADGIGLVLGYNAIDNVKTGIAEKFVTKPLVFEDGDKAFDVSNKAYLKEYFVNTLLDNSVQSHLLDGLREQLDTLKSGLGASMKDLLLGNKVDGYSISWELVLTFFGRCCNETLIMRNLKIHAPCGDMISVPVEGGQPETYPGGTTPHDTYNVHHYINHGESTNEMIATQRKQVGFGFGFAYTDKGAPDRNPKTDPNRPPDRGPITDPGTGPVKPPRRPRTDPNRIIRRKIGP